MIKMMTTTRVVHHRTHERLRCVHQVQSWCGVTAADDCSHDPSADSRPGTAVQIVTMWSDLLSWAASGIVREGVEHRPQPFEKFNINFLNKVSKYKINVI